MLRQEQVFNEESERIAFLDGLRGTAVLAVVVFHAARFVPAIADSTSFGTAILQQLSHGVDLFFILSGFCLAYPTLKKLRTRESVDYNVAAYGARRIVRIIPPYYAAIAACAIAALCTWFNVISPSAMPKVSAYDMVRQALFIDANVHLLNGSFWSLAVEFRWYFLFPLFLWLWVQSPRAFFLAGAGLALAALLTRAQSLDLLFLPTFMLGIVAAAAFVAKQRTRTWLVWVALFSVLAFAKSRSDGWEWTTNPLWGIAMFWLVLGAAGSPYLNTLLSHPWLTKIGYGSYAIYLTHEPVIRFLSPHLAFLKNDWSAFGVLTSIALVFGLAFSYIAERPFIKGRLRDHLISVVERGLTRSFLGITGTSHLQLLAARDAGTRVKAA